MPHSDTDQKFSILIAEDDEHIILALNAIVKKAINCEKIVLAEDGFQAWNAIVENKFDLIISDWNMPGLTGQELLDKVRQNKEYKTTPFLMLTARADKTSVISAVQAGANDYITKPYEKDKLVEKINNLLALEKQRSASIDDLAKDKTNENQEESQDIIQCILNRFKEGKMELPILPHVYNSVNKAIEKDDDSFDKIVSIIETEPAISATLITISNSSFYSGASANQTLDQAISRIGLKATKHYLFMIESKFLFKSEHRDFMIIMKKLWEHSIATAICARTISKHLKKGDMDVLFSMGLLHDIGKLPLVNILIELSDKRDDINEKVIHHVFEELHTEIGAIMLTQWSFPDEAINIVKNHHNLSDNNNSREILIVNLADILTRKIGYSLKPDDDIPVEEIESAKLLNLDKYAIQAVLHDVHKDLKEIQKQI